MKTSILVLLFLGTFFNTNLKCQTKTAFSKKVSVYTKSPSLSCPHLSLKLKDNLNKCNQKLTNVQFDNFTHAKMSFIITDENFYSRDSVLMLFSKAGYPSIEMDKIEIEGLPTIKIN